MTLDFDDIENAFLFVNMNGGFLNSAILDIESGHIYYTSDVGDSDELPDDIDDPVKYIDIPNQQDLNLGQPLVFDFAARFLPNETDTIYSFFRRKGAYSKFKDFLEQKGFLENWYDFEEKQRIETLKKWLQENNIKFKG